MLTEPFVHVTLIAGHANPMDVDSAVFPVGAMNHAQVTIKVHTLFAAGTPPSPHLNFSVWGSNSGRGDDWIHLTDFDEDITGAGGTEVSAFVTFAFVKFHLTLAITNSNPGDWATAILCCHANLTYR